MFGLEPEEIYALNLILSINKPTSWVFTMLLAQDVEDGNETLSRCSVYLTATPVFDPFTKQIPHFGDLYVPSVLRSRRILVITHILMESSLQAVLHSFQSG